MRRCATRRVSIPFIAGQWSLPRRAHLARRRVRGFNSLHCGAVVASHSGRLRLSLVSTSFNPLHCGAVVASVPVLVVGSPSRHVSIPFIAGQWSLLEGAFADVYQDELVSIPFIAGQWSLRVRVSVSTDKNKKFQSPSLRGSGRFPGHPTIPRLGGPVSIPFIAGQWSLRNPPSPEGGRAIRLFQSPSLRGSGRFSKGNDACSGSPEVSIPFIAGQWSLRLRPGAGAGAPQRFQSPSLRGSGRFLARDLLLTM